MPRQGHEIRSTSAEQALIRTVLFLRTVSSDAQVLAALTTSGFSRADAEEGWRLLRAACMADLPEANVDAGESPHERAMRAVHVFARTMIPRARAALRRLHPEQHDFLFDGMPSGARSVEAAVMAFLERCDELERSPKRKKTRKEDHSALALIAKRGVTRSVLDDARRELVVITTATAPELPSLPRDPEALERLHAWLRDWSDCARTVITRRDWLIRLGIGRRRPKRARRAAQKSAPATE